MSPFKIWRRQLRTAAHDVDSRKNDIVAPEPSDLVTEVGALRERLAALEARMPGAVTGQAARRSPRQNVKLIAVLLSGAALAGASAVYGESAVEALFVRQDGNVGIGTNNPASRLTVAGNASIGATAGAAPPNGLLVQGEVQLRDKLDVSGAMNARSINATSVNVNGAPILAGVEGRASRLEQTVNQHGQTLTSQAASITTLNRRNVRNCVARRGEWTYVANCNWGEIAVGGGGRCQSLWRVVESYPIDRSTNPIGNGAQPTGWRHTCQVWGNAGRWTEPEHVFAICCPIE